MAKDKLSVNPLPATPDQVAKLEAVLDQTLSMFDKNTTNPQQDETETDPNQIAQLDNIVSAQLDQLDARIQQRRADELLTGEPKADDQSEDEQISQEDLDRKIDPNKYTQTIASLLRLFHKKFEAGEIAEFKPELIGGHVEHLIQGICLDPEAYVENNHYDLDPSFLLLLSKMFPQYSMFFIKGEKLTTGEPLTTDDLLKDDEVLHIAGGLRILVEDLQSDLLTLDDIPDEGILTSLAMVSPRIRKQLIEMGQAGDLQENPHKKYLDDLTERLKTADTATKAKMLDELIEKTKDGKFAEYMDQASGDMFEGLVRDVLTALFNGEKIEAEVGDRINNYLTVKLNDGEHGAFEFLFDTDEGEKTQEIDRLKKLMDQLNGKKILLENVSEIDKLRLYFLTDKETLKKWAENKTLVASEPEFNDAKEKEELEKIFAQYNVKAKDIPARWWRQIKESIRAVPGRLKEIKNQLSTKEGRENLLSNFKNGILNHIKGLADHIKNNSKTTTAKERIGFIIGVLTSGGLLFGADIIIPIPLWRLPIRVGLGLIAGEMIKGGHIKKSIQTGILREKIGVAIDKAKVQKDDPQAQEAVEFLDQKLTKLQENIEADNKNRVANFATGFGKGVWAGSAAYGIVSLSAGLAGTRSNFFSGLHQQYDGLRSNIGEKLGEAYRRTNNPQLAADISEAHQVPGTGTVPTIEHGVTSNLGDGHLDNTHQMVDKLRGDWTQSSRPGVTLEPQFDRPPHVSGTIDVTTPVDRPPHVSGTIDVTTPVSSAVETGDLFTKAEIPFGKTVYGVYAEKIRNLFPSSVLANKESSLVMNLVHMTGDTNPGINISNIPPGTEISMLSDEAIRKIIGDTKGILDVMMEKKDGLTPGWEIPFERALNSGKFPGDPNYWKSLVWGYLGDHNQAGDFVFKNAVVANPTQVILDHIKK